MHKKIKHVFFDLDHTLWDFDKNSALTFQKIFNLNQLEINFKKFIAVYEPTNYKYWKLYREEKVTKPQLRYGRLKDTFNALTISISDALINKLSEDYITHLTTFSHLYEGTIELLEYLKPKYKLHIITNGFEEAQENKMQNSNIRHYFSTVTNSEMVGVKKPNPKIFKFALQQAHAQVAESIMIGDNLEADIQGADNIGFKTILFDYKNEYTSNDYKSVTSLLQITDLL